MGRKKKPKIPCAHLTLQPVFCTDGADDVEGKGAIGQVRLTIEGHAEYRLDIFACPAGQRSEEVLDDSLYIEPWRVGLDGDGDEYSDDGERPVSWDPSFLTEEDEEEEEEDDGEQPSASVWMFQPRHGFLRPSLSNESETFCVLPCAIGKTHDAADHPPGTPCPDCEKFKRKGKPVPDPFAFLKAQGRYESD